MQWLIPWFITGQYIEEHKNELIFLYADSLDRFSFSGQVAVAKAHSNCYPIFTKRDWCRNNDAYWHDRHFAIVRPIIDDCFRALPIGDKRHIIPFRGIGHGCSELVIRAPSILAYIESSINKVKYPDIKWKTPDGRII